MSGDPSDQLSPSFESESSLSQREDSVYTSSSTRSYNGQKLPINNDQEIYSFLSFPSNPPLGSSTTNSNHHKIEDKKLSHLTDNKNKSASSPNKTLRERMSYLQISGKSPSQKGIQSSKDADENGDIQLGWSINPTANSNKANNSLMPTSLTNRTKQSDKKPVRRRVQGSSSKSNPSVIHSSLTINYHGVNIYQAASQGNLPVCVLLWGMASAKRVNLMVPDSDGNNPMHYAVLADNTEVV